MCARGQVGRGTQLRTGRPCSQVPGSRWRPERLVRRQRTGGRPSRPHPARARPGLSLPATLLGSRAAAAVPLPLPSALAPGDPAMPVRTECPPPADAAAASAASLIPPPPINTQQPGVATSLLYSGSKFRGHQKSKGNSYDVEVVLQHVDTGNSYLCGYLKIKGLTEEYPTLTTFFEGEIISKKHPFLTRKWDADEDVDRKHWNAGRYLGLQTLLEWIETFWVREELRQPPLVLACEVWLNKGAESVECFLLQQFVAAFVVLSISPNFPHSWRTPRFPCGTSGALYCTWVSLGFTMFNTLHLGCHFFIVN
ncbi:glucose-induced degradation protein 4 homolog isoform X1 [Aotus nancymaae]|uniref:GID complex subunit 4 homolog n=1 Tax=Aotus nancymaae TaxID=37293 RepID=A0A2K5EL00_AOTNA